MKSLSDHAETESSTGGNNTTTGPHWAWPLYAVTRPRGSASRMWLDEGDFAPGRLAVAAITATMISPVVYRKTMADSESHL